MVKLKDLLLSADFLKQAGPENPSQQQLEQDFGALAYNFLADRAPKLIDYLLGFETVDQEEDGSRAVGIFGFKIDDVYYYVPVFFIHNQIKGMDMLFNKKTNTFIPLQEPWIDHILHTETINLGEPANNPTELGQDFESLNFDFLSSPPGPKTASSPECVNDIANKGFEVWNDIQTKIAESLDIDNEFKEAFASTIACVQNKGKEIYKYAEDVSHSDLVAFLEDSGGPNAVSILANSFNNIKFANAALTFYPSVKSLIVNEFSEKLAPKAAQEKVKVVTDASEIEDDLDRKKIVTHGFTIKDIRDSSEKSEVFPNDYTQKFTNPSEPGKYDVLLSNGGTTEAWVFLPALPDAQYVTAYEPKTKSTMSVKANKLFVRGDKIDDSKTPYKDAVDLDKMDIHKKYVFIDDGLRTSGIFCPSSIVAANNARTTVKGYFKHNYDPIVNESTWSPTYHEDTDVNEVQIADFESKSLRVVGDKLIVPSNWKALEVGDSFRSLLDDPNGSQIAFEPGNLLDLDEALFKNAVHKLIVENPDRFGNNYFICMDDFTEGPLTYKTAACKLVKGYGLNVDDAYELLKEADINIKSRRLVKIAQGVGVAMPPPHPEQMTVDPYTGAMMQSPQTQQMAGEFTGVPALQDPMQPGFNMGGQSDADVSGGASGGVDEEVASLLEQAAQTGQRKVFDQGAIAGLTKIYDVSSVIDMYLPDMVKAMDRLGRILFLYYWKNLEFTDRYGSEDIANMEDNLRSVFKNYGDLILKLKEKSISQGEHSLI